MKTYVIIISKYFPKTHKRAKEETFFVDKILAGQSIDSNAWKKIHTIKSNYDLWKKRIDKVNNGSAVLSLRYWSGRPYNSEQIEICKLDRDSGIGIQKIIIYDEIISLTIEISENNMFVISYPLVLNLCKNDGLSFKDFKDWFENYNFKEPFALIHFTKFRY
jgi:hypothetical protein